MSAIKIGISLLLNGWIEAIPFLLLAMTFFMIRLKDKKVIAAFFLEMLIVVSIISLTLLGILEERTIQWNIHNINFLPFYTNWNVWKSALSGDVGGLVQIIGNILIFVPFGIVFRQIHGKNIKKMVIVAILFPLGIELTQCVAGRVGDIDDIICNFVGSMFGYYIHAYISFVYRKTLEMQRDKGVTKSFYGIWSIIWVSMIVKLVL